MANLARREIGLVQRIECHASRRGPQRLGGFILRQLPVRDAPQLMRLPAPKVIIASLLSMTKESLSRGLARLAAAALLSVRGRQLQVPARVAVRFALSYGRGCYVCFGPQETPNNASLKAAWRELGVAEDELLRAYRTFNAAAEGFRTEAKAHEK